MKKKIINGIMMVALLVATSTSFVSCKDTNEDVRISEAAELSALKQRLDNLEELYGDIDKNRIPALKKMIETNGDNIDALQEQVDELEVWLIEAFAKLITNVEISYTYSNMLGSINIPGFEPRLLISNYGTAANDVEFPKSADFKGDKVVIAKGESIGEGDKGSAGFAGFIYANVNRYIDDLPLLSKSQGGKLFDITIANSVGEDIEGLEVRNMDDEGNPTKDLLDWGWTRADNNIYKFGVAYYGSKASDFEPARLDLSKFKEDVKAVWRNRNSKTGNSKQALGHLVADLYFNLLTKDYNMKKYLLKFKWTDSNGIDEFDDTEYNKDYQKDENGKIVNKDTVNEDTDEKKEKEGSLEHLATSQAELVFAAIKPFGFTSGPAIAANVDKTVKSFNHGIEKSEALWNKIFNKIKAQLPNLSPDQIKDIIATGNLTEAGGVWTLHTTIAGNPETIDVTSIIAPLNESLDNVKAMLASAQKLVDKLDGKTITNWVEKFTNKFDDLFAKNANQMLQPVLLAIDKAGNVNRVSGIEALPFEATADEELRLEPTTYTAELFAPAYVKYVGCKDINAKGFNEIIYSNMDELKFTPEKGKTYEIVYEAVDFFGYTVENKYYIKGK